MQLLVLSTNKTQQVTYVCSYHHLAYDTGTSYRWTANYYFPITDSKTSLEWSILHFLDPDRYANSGYVPWYGFYKGQAAIQFTLEYYERFYQRG